MFWEKQPFNPSLSRNEKILGLIYLPIHFFVLPILVGMAAFLYGDINMGMFNLVYFAIGVLFLALVMRNYLMRQFDVMLDNKLRSFLTVPFAFSVDFGLTLLLLPLLFLMGFTETAPNNEALASLQGTDYNILKALAIFIAPFIEEVLFRGVLFGSIRPRNRILAYVVTVLVFALLHVWQFALEAADWMVLLEFVRYIPISVALCWCYERSGTIWSPIAMHMLLNVMSYTLIEAVL